MLGRGDASAGQASRYRALVHFVVMGCGRVGAQVAQDVERLGHSVAVVDQDPEAFRRLGPDFSGQTVTGVGFDQETLEAARVQEAFGFAAVSNGDNSNILAARVAHENYGVERVVARIYDSRRAAVFQRLGIPTVATVPWTSDQVMRRLLPSDSSPDYLDPSGKVGLVEMGIDPGWIGRRISRLEAAAHVRVAYLVRMGSPVLPGPDTVFQDGDIVHVAALTGKVRFAETVAGQAPPDPAEQGV